MPDETNGKEPESGFELAGQFYKFTVSDGAKDLMLIDRVTGGMPVREFFEAVNDVDDRGRGPVLLALVATSIRAANPDWSVQRITRMVENMSISDLEIMGPEDDEGDEDSPPVEAASAASPSGSTKPSAASKSSSTPAES